MITLGLDAFCEKLEREIMSAIETKTCFMEGKNLFVSQDFL